jgi:hypothetical protein
MHTYVLFFLVLSFLLAFPFVVVFVVDVCIVYVSDVVVSLLLCFVCCVLL